MVKYRKFTSFRFVSRDNTFLLAIFFIVFLCSSSEGLGAWDIRAVGDSATDEKPYIELDGSGNIHILYYGSSDRRMTYIKGNGRSWTSEHFLNGNGADNSSMTIDKNGYPHFCYYDPTGVRSLEYVYQTELGWNEPTTVDSTMDVDGIGQYCDIAMDSNNNPYILYHDSPYIGNEYIRYAHYTNGTWDKNFITLHPGVGGPFSLILDDLDFPHVV